MSVLLTFTPKTFIMAILDYLVLYIPAAILCLIPSKKYFKEHQYPRYTDAFVILILLCIVLPVLEILTGEPGHPNNFDFIPIVCTIWFLISVDLDYFKSLYIITSATCYLSFGGLISFWVDALIQPHGNSLHFSLTAILVQAGIYLLIIFVAFFFFRKPVCDLMEYNSPPSVWRTAWVLPTAVTICNMVMAPKNYANMYIGKIWLGSILVFLVEFVLLAQFQMSLFSIIRYSNELYESEKEKQLLSLQTEQYHQLEENVKQVRQIRHDFKQVLNTMDALIEENNLEELKKFLASYRENNNLKTNYIFFCKQPSVNALLSYFWNKMNDANIKTNWKVSLDAPIQMDATDLCILIGNVLENAFRACRHIPEEERFVHLSVDNDTPGSIYIVIENSFDGNIQIKKGKIQSTKQHHEGMGLTSIAVIAKKYDGFTEFYHEDNIFYSHIMLKI